MLRGKRNDMRNSSGVVTKPWAPQSAHCTRASDKKTAVRRNYTLPLACCAASATICATPAALFHQPWSQQSVHCTRASDIKKSAVRRNYTLPLACCAASATICATPAARLLNHGSRNRRVNRAMMTKGLRSEVNLCSRVSPHIPSQRAREPAAPHLFQPAYFLTG